MSKEERYIIPFNFLLTQARRLLKAEEFKADVEGNILYKGFDVEDSTNIIKIYFNNSYISLHSETEILGSYSIKGTELLRDAKAFFEAYKSKENMLLRNRIEKAINIIVNK